ncbi:hypothetical protein HCJ58_14925 [Listeria sp. FSL L7-1509]|uniref:YcaO domain-containing protein n=1 Tax=Listeria immobilis TaxID=2713502 RepID=A0ABR6STM3_9LIST|nr:YcaO-like family protein [Listeria immobilis]MBC1484176.1 hypothetical protein [Listeria immobilis]MBC1508245.1 hypothetical protein [Listeria immobilis]MBC1508763.1 hypothetical protein [Listeria immobilis]MBC6304629.1 hypothetical protein [Listeria immobilis]MBC6313997.1 hypothetical protein [Listeria immobilis]
MTVIKRQESPFLDEKYGLIKNIYTLPTYYGLPRVYVKMAFGGNYSTAGFNASGAGVTKSQANNSAIGEYIERYSCLHPNQEIQINNEEKINPSIFNKDATDNLDNYQWIMAYDCQKNKYVSVPADAIYLTYRSEKGSKWITTSTGAACGSNLNQCMWKGIAEIFERDAFQYIWRRQLTFQQIDIKSSKRLETYYKKYIKCDGIKIKLYRMELDWEMPAVFGVAEFENGGCVVSASVRFTWIEACEKTLLELAQSIVGYAAVILKKEKKDILDFSLIKEYQDHSLLYMSDNMSQHLEFLNKKNKKFELPHETIELDDGLIKSGFIKCVNKINKKIYFANVTSPELKNSSWLVGKTIIPGMLDIEPDFVKFLKDERLDEIDRNLIKMNKRDKQELNKKQPKIPHPFP